MNDATDLDTTYITTIRTLAIDAFEAADSGHLGMAMALAAMACGRPGAAAPIAPRSIGPRFR